MDERIKRLRDLAAEAKGQYRVELESGGKPIYPTWIDDIEAVCKIAEKALEPQSVNL